MDDLSLKKEEMEDEIEFCKEEKKRLSDQHPTGNDTYKAILKQFINKWNNNETEEREDLIRTLVRTVTSNVDSDNSGNIEVKYIADKKLEAEWIKR